MTKYLDNFLCVSITPMSIFMATHRYHHSPPTLNAPQNSHLELALFMIQPQLGQFIIRTSHLPCHYLLVPTVSLHISRPTFPQPLFNFTLLPDLIAKLIVYLSSRYLDNECYIASNGHSKSSRFGSKL